MYLKINEELQLVLLVLIILSFLAFCVSAIAFQVNSANKLKMSVVKFAIQKYDKGNAYMVIKAINEIDLEK